MGFYYTKLARPGHDTSDIEQLFVRFGVGQESRGSFELFGSEGVTEVFTPSDLQADGELLQALEAVGMILLQRRASKFGGTIV